MKLTINRKITILVCVPIFIFISLAFFIASNKWQDMEAAKSVVLFLDLLMAGVSIAIGRSISSPIAAAARKLGQASDKVSNEAAQAASSGQQLAESVSQQAASIEESSSALDQIASLAKTNTETVKRLEEAVARTDTGMKNSYKSLKKTIEVLARIAISGEEMAKINKSIEQIAFQTNLLALNAAVEAARAGEAGAGFAVVADEVRALATRASEAARNTENLISQTLEDLKCTTEHMNQTKKEFVDMGEYAKMVSTCIVEIGAAAREQTSGIEQVDMALRQMSHLVQQSAANAEESASGAEEMNWQAKKMKEFVTNLVNVVSGNGNHVETHPTTSTDKPQSRPAAGTHRTETAQGRGGKSTLPSPVGQHTFLQKTEESESLGF